MKSSNRLIHHSGCNQQFIFLPIATFSFPKSPKNPAWGQIYNSDIYSIHAIPTSSLGKPHGRLGLRMLRQKQLSTLELPFKTSVGQGGRLRERERAQPHLQFGVGCIDQPIAKDRMPVLNVGPTVRQGSIHVSSLYEVPRSTSKTATPTHSHSHGP